MTHQLSHSEFPFAKRAFPIVLVCDHITFQPNIGSLFRICEAFGVEQIIFVGKGIALTPRKISRTSRSTHLTVSHQELETKAQAVQYLMDGSFHIIALEITANSTPLRSTVFPSDKAIALIAGSEIAGVSPELLEPANQTVHVEMYGGNSSMNVVQAAAIALYDITGKIS